MEFHVLGPLQVRVDGIWIPIKAGMPRRLLAVLLSRAGQAVPVPDLVDGLWPDNPPTSSLKTLQIYVHRLRRTLNERDRITRHPAGYLLRVDAGELDATTFVDLVRQARQARSAADPERAEQLLDRALALWAGTPYTDVADCPALQPEVERLAEWRLQAHEEHAAIAIRRGRSAEKIPQLSVLVAQHPFRERFCELLMLALHQSGRKQDALAAYRQLRQRLTDELGIEPTTDLRHLHQAILRDEPGLAAGTAAPVLGDPIAESGADRGSQPRHAVSPVPAPATLPRPPAGFVGRDEALIKLRGLILDPAGGPAIVTGMPGVGKTALALHACHSLAADFPDGRLFVDLRGFDPHQAPVTTFDALGYLLSSLGVPAQYQPASIEERAGRFTSLLNGGRTLILLDDAASSQQVRALLPGNTACAVVITSRTRLDGLTVADGARHLTLDGLTPDGCRMLLGDVLGPARVNGEPEAVDRLIEATARLPLALRIVAAQVATAGRQSLAAVAHRFERNAARLGHMHVEDGDIDLRRVFDASYSHLPRGPAYLFLHLGLHPGTVVTAHAAAATADLDLTDVQQHLTSLARAHLLAEEGDDTYRFHDLVADYARDRADADLTRTNRDGAVHRILDYYLAATLRADRVIYQDRAGLPITVRHSFALPEFTSPADALDWLDNHYPTLLSALALADAAAAKVHLWQLPYALQVYCTSRARWLDCIEANEKALTVLDGTDPQALIAISTNLGVAYSEQRRYAEALANFSTALRLHRGLGAHAAAARILNNIGVVHARMGDHDRAIECHQQSRMTLRRLGEPAGEMKALVNLADAYVRCGKAEEGRTQAAEVLTLLTSHPNPRIEAAALECLAGSYAHSGDYPEAARYYARAIRMAAQAGELDQQARLHDQLGRLLLRTDPTRAANNLRQALTIYAKLAHPATDSVRTLLDHTTGSEPAGPDIPPSVPAAMAAEDAGATRETGVAQAKGLQPRKLG